MNSFIIASPPNNATYSLAVKADKMQRKKKSARDFLLF